jgi:polygalacturonase
LPPGKYFSGPLWLKNGVELWLEAGATVVMSRDRNDWPRGVRALVLRDVSNLVLEGFRGEAAQTDGRVTAIVEANVTRPPAR